MDPTMSDFTRPNPIDEEIDAAMRTATRGPSGTTPEVSFKRQSDPELDAELEAVMAGFDAESLQVGNAGPRTRAADRANVPKGGVGQETRKGMQVGKVVAVRGKSVFVDLGAKSEGVVPTEQFGENLPAPGDPIEVRIDHFDTSEGLLILSLKGAAVEASWENLRKGLIVEAKVVKTNKGGLDVEVDGIRGFLPIGQIDVNRVEDASIYVGHKFKVIVTDANQREKNLVVSRRDLVEQERAEAREKTWKEIEEGQVREGTVRSVKDFGVFVDVGGIDGLLHIADMSWTRLKDVGELLKVGDKVQVKILKIDRTTQKVGLGLKQLMPSPWDLVEDKYERGHSYKGKVTRLMDFGAFVELEPGIEGLVHISELSPNRVRRVSDIVKPDQEVEVRILKIEPDAKKIALSLKPLPNATPIVADDEDDDDETPAAPKPERKIPLKGGRGDKEPNPFGTPPA